MDPTLVSLFQPSTLALIGATDRPGSVGATLWQNLLASRAAALEAKRPLSLYPIHPTRKQLDGHRVYPHINAIEEHIDLAILATPAPTIYGLLEGCKTAKVSHTIILSAGFSEMGQAGKELEASLRTLCLNEGPRILGPNCLGIMVPPLGLNATFAPALAPVGRLAFLSQSGALLTSFVDMSARAGVGWSACVSVGSMVDVQWAELLNHFAHDNHTDAILIYAESIPNPRAFLASARLASIHKPLVILKAGKTPGAAVAAASHTGHLTGSDPVMDAAFREAGLLRVSSIQELLNMAKLLSSPRFCRSIPKEVIIITNAGGPGVLATDTLLSEGAELASLTEDTKQKLNACLPPSWSHHNPIDLLGDASAERYRQALDALQNTPAHTLLAVLTPQATTQPIETAQQLVAFSEKDPRPIAASWMGGACVEQGRMLLLNHHIPLFDDPEQAAWAISRRCKLPELESQDLELLTPAKIQQADDYLKQFQDRSWLSESESKKLLAIYDLPTTPCLIATSPEEAARAAEHFHQPVAIKIHSSGLIHKHALGCVLLNITSAKDAEVAFHTIQERASIAGVTSFEGVTVQPMFDKPHSSEIIVGAKVDPDFGLVILLGAGGVGVEQLGDYQLALLPLRPEQARRLLLSTRIGQHIAQSLPSKQLEQLVAFLVRFGDLMTQQETIVEMEVNPLSVSPNHIQALDARLRLAKTPRPGPALTPLPLLKGASKEVSLLQPGQASKFCNFLMQHQKQKDEKIMWDLMHSLWQDQLLREVCSPDYYRTWPFIQCMPGNDGETDQIIAATILTRELFLPTGWLIILGAEQAAPDLIEASINLALQQGLYEINIPIAKDDLAWQERFPQLQAYPFVKKDSIIGPPCITFLLTGSPY